MESLAARLTRQSGTSFYWAFRVLPLEKRRAIYAVYSFCRMVDDCVDEVDGERGPGLDRWLQEVERCYAGAPQTELGRELAEAVARFPIPRACFEQIVAGCRMDLTTHRYATFADLTVYCERVACAVGLAAIEIFGYTEPATREYARALGLALQLTNILRDLASDAARDRIYLPQDELARFGVAEADLVRGLRTPGLDRLLTFQAERARAHYAQAAAVLPERDRRSMLSARIMGAIYRDLLEHVVRLGFPLTGPRVRLSTPRKLWIAARTTAGTLLA